MKINYIYLYFLLLISFISCNKEEFIKDSQSQNCNELLEGKPIILGEKINNPYSIENMKKALELLNNNSLSKSSIVIEPTHYYVKIIPKNFEQIFTLEKDTSIFFYNYPIDYQILEEGSYYLENPNDSLPNLYATIPVDYQFDKDINYEILDKYFNLDETNNLSKKYNFQWEELKDKAYKITSQDYDYTLSKKSKWRPLGYLYFQDDVLGKIPLEGVPVRMRHMGFTHQCCTDKNGYFFHDKTIKGKCDYSIKWKRNDFSVIHNLLNSIAESELKKNYENTISYTFTNSLDWYYAAIFRGAYTMYYGNIHNLRRPITGLKLKASTKEKDDKSAHYCNFIAHTEGLNLADIKIFSRGESSDYIYTTTIHELFHAAHATHCQNVKYKDVYDIVKESWARGASVNIANDIYPLFEKECSRKRYTGIISDLMDNDSNIKFSYKVYKNDKEITKTYFYTDKVSGYTINQIESALYRSKSWNDFKINLKNLYNNATEIYLDDLFNDWDHD